ncbi:MAG: Peptidase, M56 family [Candidatus Magasanikbacteria bacterium GW2011_GWC2_37_14]|uniref:Peptidase, M56 family n=1 Tax=Candidatus Magasanikbacteria bacterium GW2011_GWC2_37_14 TaxID=1619046 RepID=A0A0G0GM54_9BACT|nr:MAG: Peptidase, M56 family [Candidatus Magasanikbacteria bacterium GW2011_GWC2_37_14]
MKQTFAQRSSRSFGQLALIFIAVATLVSFLFFKIAQRIKLLATVFIHKLEVACGCTQMTQLAAMHPFITTAIVILSVLILAFIVFLVYKFVTLLVQTRKFYREHLKMAKMNLSSRLKRTIFNLGIKSSLITEIKENKPVVFCYGLIRPRICVSSGLVKILKHDELQAVLLHENQHRLSFDPLKLFVIKFFQNIFFFLPGLKTFINKYLTFSELAADEQATNNFTDGPKLARAIFKITQVEEQNTLRTGLATSFFTSTIEERVNKLADNNYLPQFKIWGRGFVFGISAVILVVLATFIFLADSTKAFDMHNTGNCAYSERDHSSCNLTSESVCGNTNSLNQKSCEVNYSPVDK